MHFNTASASALTGRKRKAQMLPISKCHSLTDLALSQHLDECKSVEPNRPECLSLTSVTYRLSAEADIEISPGTIVNLEEALLDQQTPGSTLQLSKPANLGTIAIQDLQRLCRSIPDLQQNLLRQLTRQMAVTQASAQVLPDVKLSHRALHPPVNDWIQGRLHEACVMQMLMHAFDMCSNTMYKQFEAYMH